MPLTTDPVAQLKEQQNFEEMWDRESLTEPLTEADADQIGEELMILQSDARLLFTRARYQYQGETWISQELWQAYSKLEEVWDIFQKVWDHGGFDDPRRRDRTASVPSTLSNAVVATPAETPIGYTPMPGQSYPGS